MCNYLNIKNNDNNGKFGSHTLFISSPTKNNIYNIRY